MIELSNKRIEISKKDLEQLGLFGSMLGHVGDGNFHETILFDRAKERDKVANCVHDMVHRAIEMEGTCTVSTSRSFPPLWLLILECRASMASALERRISWRKRSARAVCLSCAPLNYHWIRSG
jgi:hypothetical protein